MANILITSPIIYLDSNEYADEKLFSIYCVCVSMNAPVFKYLNFYLTDCS